MTATPQQANRRRVALVVGSGDVKSVAALGLWKVLEREGIEVTMAVGCSGGSLYAAVIALGYDLETATALTRDLWTPKVMEGYAANVRAAQSGTLRFDERSGLVDDGPLMASLRGAFGERTFAQARIPLYLVATDFANGEKVVLSEGPLVDAVRASIAIPTIWSPRERDGRLLVDGAVCDPLPVDVAIREGAAVIVAMGFELPYRSRMRSLTAVNAHLNAIYINNLLRATYAFHNVAHHAELLPIVPRFDRAIGMFDTHLFPYIIEEGERAAEAQLPYLRRLLNTATG